jgi:S1-C subfamily serine protease
VSPRTRLLAALAAASALALGLIACGGGESLESTTEADSSTEPAETEQIVVSSPDSDFDPAGVYEKAAPGVVTVLSIFGGGGADAILGGGAGQGSGFVVSDEGEIVTNAHVVTSGGSGNGGGQPKQASEVYVEFSDRNRVPADVIGFDPDADVALIKVDPGDIELQPIPISERNEYAVGEPVAAIGSPFGERQSLSVGIVSAVDRSIQSLTPFAIDNAIQTDASINPGNSGGPLLDSDGEVIGINQQIESSSGTNSGVGFAIPVSALRFSLDQLREDGSVDYAYIGVSTQGLWPQLADELEIETDVGALISDVVPNGPADEAGLKGSDGEQEFQGAQISTGGDVIVAVDGKRLEHESDLAELISRQRPGDTVTLEILREGRAEEIQVELAERPERVARQG